MRKAIFGIVLIVSLGTAAVAEEAGIYIKPEAALTLGIGNYFRGGAIGGTVMFSTGGLWAGVEVLGDFDAGYNVVAFPIFLEVGFGHAFWLMAGQTFSAVDPYLVANEAKAQMRYGTFPNTFGLGVAPVSIPIGDSSLKIYSEITYTVMTAKDEYNNELVQAAYALSNALLGLKAYVGVALELKVL